MIGERRRYPRAPLMASALVTRAGEAPGIHRVVNFSAGGMLLAGELSAAAGSRVTVVLRFSRNHMVRADAVLVGHRNGDQGSSFALAFCDLTDSDRDRINEAALAVIEESRTASVLIVGDSVDTQDALRVQVHQLGKSSFAVNTSLAAVQLLEAQNAVSVAIVSHDVGLDNGLDMIAYLADEHPGVRRVLMSSDIMHADRRARWHVADGVLAHDVLPKPWTHDLLWQAIST